MYGAHLVSFASEAPKPCFSIIDPIFDGATLACCSLHPRTSFWRSRSARTVDACTLPAVFKPVTAAAFWFWSLAILPDNWSSPCRTICSLLSTPSSSLLVREAAGDYRPAEDDEMLAAVQRVLASRVRGAKVMTSSAVVNDFLRARLGPCPMRPLCLGADAPYVRGTSASVAPSALGSRLTDHWPPSSCCGASRS